MYQIENRVRYSETDADGFLTMTGIINYFQDCSIFHSEDCGVGVQWLKKRTQSLDVVFVENPGRSQPQVWRENSDQYLAVCF